MWIPWRAASSYHWPQVALAALLSVLCLRVTGEAQKPIFADRTAETGLDFVHFNGMSGELYFPEMMGSGGALFDYDNDGDLDLYLVQGRMLGPGKTIEDATFPPSGETALAPDGAPIDRLFRNDLTRAADGSPSVRFVDVTAKSGLSAGGYGMGVAAADFDNDGWIDLYLTNFGPNQLWRNRGDGTFEDLTEASRSDDNRWSVPAVAFDYDGDGWIDLFVGNFVDGGFSNHKTCMTRTAIRTYCSPSIFPPWPDKLLRNQGAPKGLRFEDVTSRTGIDQAFGPALGAVAADFDGDGWIDLYVANDGAPNQLWINSASPTSETGRLRRFEDQALLAGSAVNRDGMPEASMGVDAADFDGDGDPDLFMTHLTEETNTLYVNDGTGMFDDVSVSSGLARPSFSLTGFGTGWLDVDNDGRLDLLAVNGAVTVIEELYRRRDPYPLHQLNQLFLQRAAGGFEDAGEWAGPAFELSEVSRGAIVGDLDNDGDPDVVVTNNAGPARVLFNQVGQDAPWLGLRLVAGVAERDALGARAALHRPGRPAVWRRVEAGGSYASARDPRLLFGLGDGPTSGTVRVHWPRGAVEEWSGLEAGLYHTLREGSGRVK